MPIGISFQSTQDNYSDPCTLGPSDQLRELSFIVANNSVKYQLAKLDPAGNPYWDVGELATSPTVGGFQDVYGIRFRSYTPGSAAVIVAEGFFNDDPSPVGGTPYTATLSGSGSQSPGQASVEIDHNGVAIGTEPKINFVDTNSGLPLAIADDVANQRVTIAAKMCRGAYATSISAGQTGVVVNVPLPAGFFSVAPTTVIATLSNTSPDGNLRGFVWINSISSTQFQCFASFNNVTPNAENFTIYWIAVA